MADQTEDPLASIIERVLDAEQRGAPIDREALFAANPDQAVSLRDFFRNHDRMKNEAGVDLPTLPPDIRVGPIETPGDTATGEDATLPPTGAQDEDGTLPPSPTVSATAENVTPRVGDQVRYFGDYELVEEIARGGMGVVFKARQLNLNRVVALKMILAGQFAGDEDVQRFQIEAEAAAQLDHPGIVPIFEIGEHSGQHYFSMGFVEGDSLAGKISEGPLQPMEATAIVQKVCDAMAYAHERGVIHRDLKPANILIDVNGQPKVTDFGLAKKTEADSAVTGTGQILGTPAYMPPEQAAGGTDDVGPLADVYALGAVLYCLLTGRPPFQAATPIDTLMQVLDREPAPPSQLNPAISNDLQTVTLKCLEKDPSKRYSSAGDLAEELGRILRGEPIHARPISNVEKAYRWCKRHPSVSGLLGALAAAILAIMIGGYYSAYRMNDLRKAAEDKRFEAETLAERNESLAERNRAIAEQEAAQRETAETQKQLAERKQAEAERLAEENRQQLVRTRLMRADSLIVDKGDPGAALPYYLSAMELDEGRPEETHRHRRRIHAALGEVPKFTQLWRHDSTVHHLAISPDESRVASSSLDRTVQIRNLDTGELVFPPLQHDQPVWSSAFSPDGKTLVTASGSALTGAIQFWNLVDGSRIGDAINTGLNPFVVKWTGSGTVCAATISMQGLGAIKVFDPETRSETHAIPFSAIFAPPLIQQNLHGPTSRFVRIQEANRYRNVIEVFDLEKPNQVVASLEHPDQVLYATFSSDGSRLVTATWQQMFMWDVDSGEQIAATGEGELRSASFYPNPAMRCAFTFDSRSVSATSAGNWSVVFNEDGKLRHLKEFSQFSTTDKFPDPSGRLMAYAEQDGTVHLWDAFWERFFCAPIRHSATLQDLRFTRDGRRVITGCADGLVRVWDLATMTIQREKRFAHNRAPVGFADLSPDGSEITTGATGWIELRNYETGNRIRDTYLGDGIVSVVSSPNSDLAAFGNSDHAAVILNRRTGERLQKIKHDLKFVRSVQLSDDGNRLATVSVKTIEGPEAFFGRVNLFDLATGDRIAGPLDFASKQSPSLLTRLTGMSLSTEAQGVISLAIRPDGKQIAYGGALLHLNGEMDPRLRIHDVGNDVEIDLDCGGGNFWEGVESLEYSTTGKYLIGKSQSPMTRTGGAIRVWDSATKELCFGPVRVRGRCEATEISPDETVVAFAEDRVVHVYGLKSGKPMCRPLRHPANVTKVEFSPDQELATTSQDLAVRLWDINDGRLLAPPIKSTFTIQDLEVLDDSRLLICSSSYADIWRLSATEISLKDLTQRMRLFTGIAGLDDAGEVVSVSRDVILEDWNAIKEAGPSTLAVSDDMIESWYSQQIDDVGSQRDYATLTFRKTHLLAHRADDGHLEHSLAGNFGENRQYAEAARYYEMVVNRDPKNRQLLFELAHARLRAGDREGYQAVCDDMVELFADTENPSEANQTGKTLLLGKAECEDEELPFRLIKRAYDAEPKNQWHILDQANAEKEKGNFEACRSLCDQLTGLSYTDVRLPTAVAIRSIANRQLGNDDLAAKDLQKAQEAREYLVNHVSGIWLNLAVCDQLISEAVEALK